ncbi:MAG: repeat-containing protein [Planctomycetaceae bacterium]|nr:repeat-containing protein [Planctomycetaceae bacterium]
MTQTVPQPEPAPVIAWPSRFGRRLKFCAVLVLGLACLTVCVVVWQRLATERWWKAGMASIPRGDIVMMDKAIRHLPANSSRVRLLRGAINLRNDRPETALRNLEGAVQDPETALWAQFLAGEALCRLQDYEACIKTLQGALEQDPNNVDGHRWLAVAYFDIGAAAEAVEQMKTVARLDDADPRSYRMLGLIYTEAEEFPQAIEAYQASLDRSRDQPDMDQILAELATAQLKVNRNVEVLATLEGAPASAELDSLQAEALYALGRNDEAKQIVQRVLRAGKTARALVLQGLMLLDERRAAEAVAPLQSAVALHPEDFETRAKLTQAYSQAGNVNAARHELAEFERIKKVRQEIHELTLIAANRPEAVEVRYELGLHYRQLGLIPIARKWIRAALALDPAHPAARKLLAEISDATSTSDRNSNQ